MPGPDDPDEAASTSLVRVGRNTGILFASQVATWLISAVVMATLPRILGPESIGELAVAASLWAIAGVFVTFGTVTVVTLDSARQPDRAGELIGPAWRVQIVMSVAAAVVVLAFVSLADYSAGVVALAAIVGAVTAAGTLANLANGALVGLERMGIIARATVLARLVGAVATLTVVFTTRSVYAVAATSAVSTLVSTMLLMGPLARATPVSLRARWGDARAIARRGVPYLVAGLALIVYQQVDTVVMSLLVDSVQIGWYGAADTLFGTLLFAPTIFMTALLPTLTREHAIDAERARTTLGRAFDVLVVLAVPVGLITVVVARPFTKLLYGDEFVESGPVLAVFGIVLLFTFFSVLLGSYAVASGRQAFWNWVMVIAIVSTVVLDLFLVPWTNDRFGNGALGGAIAFVITEAFMVVVGFWKLAPDLVTARRFWRVAKCAIAGAGLLGAASLAADRFFVIPALVGGLVYVVLVAVLKVLGTDEIAALKRMASRQSP